jgi:hypothetical protein
VPDPVSSLGDGAERSGSRHITRLHFLRQIQSTRLGGADRIVRDDIDPTPGRYAHICEGDSGPTVHTTETPELHPGYAALVAGGSWRHKGTIDLETGDLADAV